MKQLYILLFLFSCMYSCAQKSGIETDVVKNHKIHIELITDTTNIPHFMNGIPYSLDYGRISIFDNRVLVFNDIPVLNFSVSVNDDLPQSVEVELFKDTEENDIKEIKKYLTAKYGEPEVSEYDEKRMLWKNEEESIFIELKQYESEYANPSNLKIEFRKNSSYYY